MRVCGWKFEGAFPDIAQFVVIFGPHTSNWDFFLLLSAKWALQLDVSWMGKDAMFRSPVGWLLKALGGIAVERDCAHNVVDRSIRAFAERPQLVLVLAPEGTRKKVPRWKSGFWHIAQGAGVPIVCVAMDYHRKVIRLGPEFIATETDADAGIARVKSSYAGVLGRHPDRQS